MGREIKRVPLDFNWPLRMPWKGYVCPYSSQECKLCGGTGYNPETRQISDDWYDFDGRGTKWCHDITQDEVDALIKAGRLMDFTHRWTKDEGWRSIEPQPVITAETVNVWSRRFLGHDAINQNICVRTRAKRLGVYGICPLCDGEGEIWFSDAIKELAENWEEYDPPIGDGWQVWETVSEGSPVSPVFASSDELVSWLQDKGYSEVAARRFVETQWSPSLVTYLKPDGTVQFASDIESLTLTSEQS